MNKSAHFPKITIVLKDEQIGATTLGSFGKTAPTPNLAPV